MKLSTEQGAASAPPGYFHSHKVAIIGVVALIGVLVGGNLYQMQALANQSNQENLRMMGQLKVWVNGQLVWDKPDLIEPQFYDFIFCKTFNYTAGSTACNGDLGFLYGTGGNGPSANGCRSYSTSGTINVPNGFDASSRCSALAAILTTDTTAPSATNNNCANGPSATILNATGLAPVKMTTVHVIGTNTITLTGTWTATGSVTGIDKACIGVWNDKTNAFVHTVPQVLSLTSDLFTAQNVASGQSFQVQWTISL